MFQMYSNNHDCGKFELGLCSTQKVGAQRVWTGGIKWRLLEDSKLVFIEDYDSYDYFTVHLEVDGFGHDDAVLYSARTLQECEEYIQLHQREDKVLGILGQKFGQDIQTLWE